MNYISPKNVYLGEEHIKYLGHRTPMGITYSWDKKRDLSRSATTIIEDQSAQPHEKILRSKNQLICYK